MSQRTKSLSRVICMTMISLLFFSATGCDAWKSVKQAASGSNAVQNQNSASVPPPVSSGYSLPKLSDISDPKIFDDLKGTFDSYEMFATVAEVAKFEPPEGADDMLKLQMDQFCNEPKLKTVYSFPTKDSRSRLGVDMSIDGKTLYIIDEQDKIHIIDIDAGKDSDVFDAPLAAPYALARSVDGKHLFVANDSTLVKYSLEKKAVEQKLEGLPAKFIDFKRAAAKDTLVALTTDEQILVVEPEFQEFKILQDCKAQGEHVAIHPDGKYVAGASSDKIFRWYFTESQPRVETLRSDMYEFFTQAITSDYYSDRWFNSYVLHEYVGDAHTPAIDQKYFPNGPEDFSPIALNVRVVDAVSCASGDNNWVTAVSILCDEKPGTEYVLNSFGWRPVETAMIKLDARIIVRLWSTREGERVTLYTDKDVRVCDRMMFDDPTGELTAGKIAYGLYRGVSLQNIEYCANYLRSQNWPKKRTTGEHLYTQIINKLGDHWAYLEKNSQDSRWAKLLADLEAWKDSGNEMAMTASAYRHFSLGYDARGGGWAHEVTPQGFAELERRVALARADIDQVLAKSTPSSAAFQLSIGLKNAEDGQINDAFEQVKACMKLHPEDLDIHGPIFNMLLPRWHGVPGANHTYILKIANLYPPDMRDAIYAALMSEALLLLPATDLYKSDEYGTDVAKLFRGAESLRDQGKLNAGQCEAVIHVAMGVGDKEREKAFANYHFANFAMPTLAANRTFVRNALVMNKFPNMKRKIAERQKEREAKKLAE